jgi:predicted HTH transcriptional regulator
MTPIPNFDVKEFKIQDSLVLVIKIEEGAMPPYVTNRGEIYERVSSGSFPIRDSSKLTQLYNKRVDQLEKIKRKIELSDIDISSYGN